MMRNGFLKRSGQAIVNNFSFFQRPSKANYLAELAQLAEIAQRARDSQVELVESAQEEDKRYQPPIESAYYGSTHSS